MPRRRALGGAEIASVLCCFGCLMVLANVAFATLEAAAACDRARVDLAAADAADAKKPEPRPFSVVALQRSVVPSLAAEAWAAYAPPPTAAPTPPTPLLPDARPVSERSARDERTFLIPSYPTSGSEMVRGFFSEATGLGQGEVYGPQPGAKLLRYAAVGRNGAKLPFFYDETYGPPGAAPTLLKTHFPLLVGKQRDPDFFGGSVLKTYFHGVALLARHPVDCVVGELTRWPCQRAADAAKAALDAGAADYGDRLASVAAERAACRVEAIRGLCRRVKPLGLDKLARQWADFYEYWLAAADAQDVPLRVVRYEDAVADPAATFSDLLAFMGVAVDRRRLAAAAKIQVAARPPPKTFGDRLSVVCATGWTAARPGPAATHRAAGPSLAEATILSVAGPTARRLGYRINGTLSWWVLVQLDAQCLV